MPRERRILRRRRLALTPLIDVTFLLLLFFILSSTFARFGEVELAVGVAGASTSTDTPVFLRLSETGFSVNGRPVAPEGVTAALETHRGEAPLRLLLSIGVEAR